MRPTGRHGRVIDWILGAFSVIPRAAICFVGGYRADAIRHEYPNIDLVVNPNWRVTGPAISLSYARIEADAPLWVSYADVVFRASTVRALDELDADFAIAIDRGWTHRYDRRAPREMALAEKVVCEGDTIRDVGSHIRAQQAHGEFCGLVKFTPRAVAVIKDIFASGLLPATASIPALLRELLTRGLLGATVDVAGDWAELNAPQDLAQFVLGTKAESLERLKPLLRSGVIGELVTFSLGEWSERRDQAIARVRAQFAGQRIIVRSSALSEDTWQSSSAGVFTSVVDVDADDPAAIAAAVDEVFTSYGAPQPLNHVLVQELLRGVAVSGVVMTRTPTLGAPYYVINFDSSTRRTDTVTSGEGTEVRTVYLHREAPLAPRLEGELAAIVTVIKELELLVGHDSLDIEFAVTDDGQVHVLQVRPIAGQHEDIPVDDIALQGSLRRGMEFFEQLQKRPSPFLVGQTTQLSVMSDWNPAEIIGVKPRRLAFSLYRHVITDAVWASQRARNGYRDVRPCNLIVDVLGHPYVDVRATFNSFIPARLPDELAGRLVDHYLALLRANPTLHDKVEFDILITCLAFDFDARAAELRAAGFAAGDVEQLRAGLREVTRRSVATAEEDLAALDLLRRRQLTLEAAELPPLDRAYLLIEDVRRHGTAVFANLARSGFVAVSLLRSLARIGVTTEAQTEQFLRSLRTVSGELQKDARRVATGELSWEALIAEYGHLRPGTYDICLPNYATASEIFLRPLVELEVAAEEPEVAPGDDDTRARIADELATLALGVDV
ncbi:MAG: hypothetical protein R3A51_23780, partial [Nannocystaceae bacterium]